jgi:hypothetical protein
MDKIWQFLITLSVAVTPTPVAPEPYVTPASVVAPLPMATPTPIPAPVVSSRMEMVQVTQVLNDPQDIRCTSNKIFCNHAVSGVTGKSAVVRWYPTNAVNWMAYGNVTLVLQVQSAGSMFAKQLVLTGQQISQYANMSPDFSPDASLQRRRLDINQSINFFLTAQEMESVVGWSSFQLFLQAENNQYLLEWITAEFFVTPSITLLLVPIDLKYDTYIFGVDRGLKYEYWLKRLLPVRDNAIEIRWRANPLALEVLKQGNLTNAEISSWFRSTVRPAIFQDFALNGALTPRIRPANILAIYYVGSKYIMGGGEANGTQLPNGKITSPDFAFGGDGSNNNPGPERLLAHEVAHLFSAMHAPDGYPSQDPANCFGTDNNHSDLIDPDWPYGVSYYSQEPNLDLTDIAMVRIMPPNVSDLSSSSCGRDSQLGISPYTYNLILRRISEVK